MLNVRSVRFRFHFTHALLRIKFLGEKSGLIKLFGKLHITDTVFKELNQPVPDWIEVVELKTDVHKGLSGYLVAGEATSITLASEYEDSLLIIDEIKGRKAAKEMGIPVTGSLGVLIAITLAILKLSMAKPVKRQTVMHRYLSFLT